MEDKDETEMSVTLNHIMPSDPKVVLATWADKRPLTAQDFKEQWKRCVPLLFSHPVTESDKCFDILIEVLENYIGEGNFSELLRQLTDADKPPSVCGRVFKMGEPTYSCRECGMDATCVLCVTCFKKSPHRNHNYKMGTSGGGGCCDCGDVEAWKAEPYCDIHLAGTKMETTSASLPESVADSCRAVFSAILRYAYQILTLKHSPRLPNDLHLPESDLIDSDVYCTVLYNDEIHTFEQVISTLIKTVKCPQKVAVEYVTNIDREGRNVVKCAMFQQCQETKTEIERFTARHGARPLRVDVLHTHVVAHQVFALRLLRWLQNLLTYSQGFRKVFSEVALEVSSPETSIVEGILMRDAVLWKSARTHWHRLFITGMLMEYNNKKAFAKVFTKNYGNVLKDFIRDDHDHSYSIASLSVQIFTVPTIAHYLIAEEEVLFVLLNTFLSECSSKLNSKLKLEFERNGSNGAFKRAQVILYDLRYLLSWIPTADQWTDALRKGFLQGLRLFLTLMSYMEGMDEVVRQVVQHMEFEPEWESAFNLHIKLAYLITLLIEWCGSDRVVLIKAIRATLKHLHETNAGTTGLPLMTSREVANHSVSCIQYDVSTQPVSIHLPLSRFLAGLYLHLEKHGLSFYSSEIQINPRPNPVQIVEPVLRAQVMIGQVHAGLWRRNGYSILNQLYFYHNVRCRSEMLDRDIIMMQIGATLIQSDEFLIHVLNKFNLLAWADPNYEECAEDENVRQIILLVEEMLGLLLAIICERYVPGVGAVAQDDRIKKELIQQLCIKPLAHSELNKTLPDDSSNETGMERVINEIAVFKKPTAFNGKGVYELKPEFHDQYNVFFYHYTKEELSKSEEAQRKRRKASGLTECCPPPALPALAEPFATLPDLLHCDVMFHILHTVLSRAANLRARSYSEHQVQKALHLIGHGLQEEQSKRYPFLRFAERSEKWQIEQLIAELANCQRVEAHKDLILWTVDKFRNLKAKSPVTVATPLNEKDTKEWRAKMAAEKRKKIMEQMAAMQSKFMQVNADELNEMEVEESSDKVQPEPTFTCLLCQEEGSSSPTQGQALVLSAYIQKSTVHMKRKSSEPPDPQNPTLTYPQTHTSTCGHVMHSSCWRSYFDNVAARESRRPYRVRQPSTTFNVEQQEFLCPLCECLSNAVLPLLPRVDGGLVVDDLDLERFVRDLRELGNRGTRDWSLPVSVSLSHSQNEMVHLFGQAVCSKENLESPKSAPLLILNTIYYTTYSICSLLEEQGKALFGELPSRHYDCLNSLIRLGGWLNKSSWTSPEISGPALQFISIFLGTSSDKPSIIEWECFCVLVQLTLSLPSLFGPGLPSITLAYHVISIVYYAQICQLCLKKELELEKSAMEVEQHADPKDDIRLKICGVPYSTEKVNEVKKLVVKWKKNLDWRDIQNECTPFLRRSALFHKFLYNISTSCELEERFGDTFENLCRYFNLPSDLPELLDQPVVQDLLALWTANPRILEDYPETSVGPGLIALPEDYSELINMVSTFTCPNSDRDDSRNPTMCLICGEMLCSQSYCCQRDLNKEQVGACLYHTTTCSAGVGIFLRIRECEVLLLATPNRGCFLTAPYVDRYGETDQGLRRGNPLTLCKERYQKLQLLWLGHGVHEEMARGNENSGIIGTQWHHL